MVQTKLIIHTDSDIQGGVPVFVGTRVPVKTLFDHLEAGDTLDKFLHSFPSVSREQAVAALETAQELLYQLFADSRQSNGNNSLSVKTLS
jgi:uncharacterized protein (DUF433 family)